MVKSFNMIFLKSFKRTVNDKNRNILQRKYDFGGEENAKNRLAVIG